MRRVILAAALAGLSACARPTEAVTRTDLAPAASRNLHVATDAQLSCDGRPVAVEGSRTRVTLDGACHVLVVSGAHNAVSVGIVPGGMIAVTGAHNDVWWHMTGPGRLPRLHDAGDSNSFHREGV